MEINTSVFKGTILCLALIAVNSTYAQEKIKFDFERIEDNSFLLEESYNQEPGVIQHISAFQYMKNKTWVYTFTEEWPAPGQKHQVSTTIPIMNNENSGFGDISMNYRYQAIYTNRTAFSPRFSLVLPTGNYKKGLGNGVLGYQVNLPVSFIVTPKVVTHYNLGITYTPGAKTNDPAKSDIISYNYGVSSIILVTETFNFMFEIAGNTTKVKTENLSTSTSESLFLNPGFRYAINCKSGLQIVPGIAFPFGIGPSNGEYGIFMYLSFEHPFWHPKQ